MDLLGRYLRKHGRMVALYVDRDSIFRAEDTDPSDPRPTLTQFSRALGELEIELILAYSPQAKGRIERFFQTAQDRLVKELRLAGARTMDQANVVLEEVQPLADGPGSQSQRRASPAALLNASGGDIEPPGEAKGLQ